MGMNPDTNEFEELMRAEDMLNLHRDNIKQQSEEALLKLKAHQLVCPDGSPVPDHWPVFKIGEKVVVKSYTFEVGHIGRDTLTLQAVGPLLIGEDPTP